MSTARICFTKGLKKVVRDFRGLGVVEDEGETDGEEFAGGMIVVEASSYAGGGL